MKITDDMIERGLQAYQEPWWSIDAGCGSHSDRLTVRRILILALSDFQMTTPKEEPEDMLEGSVAYPDDLRCQDCGRHHQLDAVIPSPIWNKIAPDVGLLCVDCIDARCVKAGISIEDMVRFYWTGKAGSSYLYNDERTPMLKRMGKEAEELLRQLHGYAKAQYDDDRILSQVLHDAATALAAKDEQIRRLQMALEGCECANCVSARNAVRGPGDAAPCR